MFNVRVNHFLLKFVGVIDHVEVERLTNFCGNHDTNTLGSCGLITVLLNICSVRHYNDGLHGVVIKWICKRIGKLKTLASFKSLQPEKAPNWCHLVRIVYFYAGI